MIKIESEIVRVNCSTEKCFNLLLDMNNYHKLLPEDKMTEWEANKDYFYVKLVNVFSLDMIKQNAEPFLINIKNGNRSAFKFKIKIILNKKDENTCNAQIKCTAKINPALKMMFKKPLNELFNYMASRIEKVTLSDESLLN